VLTDEPAAQLVGDLLRTPPLAQQALNDIGQQPVDRNAPLARLARAQASGVLGVMRR
jgi:hypothetical protein